MKDCEGMKGKKSDSLFRSPCLHKLFTLEQYEEKIKMCYGKLRTERGQSVCDVCILSMPCCLCVCYFYERKEENCQRM